MSGADRREPFARYRERMAAVGFRPSRKLGQNFLVEPSLCRWIAEVVPLDRGDAVLEIGAGLGFLTVELAQRAGAVIAVEVDARLAELCREELGRTPAGARVRLVVSDALGPGGRLAPEVGAAVAAALERCPRFSVVANLPYAIAGPAVAAVLAGPELPAAAVLLVQRELGERLAAGPGSRDYGGLSAVVQSGYAVALVRRVGREVFRPRPNVDSAVVRLERLPGNAFVEADAESRQGYLRFVRTLFGQRRKTLRHGYGRALAALGLGAPAEPVPPSWAAGARAQELGPDRLLMLWNLARQTLES